MHLCTYFGTSRALQGYALVFRFMRMLPLQSSPAMVASSSQTRTSHQTLSPKTKGGLKMVLLQPQRTYQFSGRLKLLPYASRILRLEKHMQILRQELQKSMELEMLPTTSFIFLTSQRSWDSLSPLHSSFKWTTLLQRHSQTTQLSSLN